MQSLNVIPNPPKGRSVLSNIKNRPRNLVETSATGGTVPLLPKVANESSADLFFTCSLNLDGLEFS